MSDFLDVRQLTIIGSSSPLSFVTEGGGYWEKWNRYLAIDGKKAFHIGNICGTCEFFFERLEGANRSIDPKEVAAALNGGLKHLGETLDKLKAIIPDGEYAVVLKRITPQLVKPSESADYFTHEQVELWGIDSFWDLPHTPKTEYYRLKTKTLASKRALFEFLVPTFPHSWLDSDRVEEYSKALARGEEPTAVAISVLDVKGPADWEGEKEVEEHWVLANYLVDGHHKVYAAAKDIRPLTLISFVATDKGISSKEHIAETLDALK